MLGVRSGATDGYDAGLDWFDDYPDVGHAAVYHHADDPGWNGPTAMYRLDYRAVPEPGTSTTWAPIHLWAEEGVFEAPEMKLSFEPDPFYPPPSDGTYTLELLYVPEGIVGAPAVGTTWTIPTYRPFTVEVPKYFSDDGLDSYHFGFTWTAAPEPSTLMLLLTLLAIRRR